MTTLRNHYDAAILCNKAYDTTESNIWSVGETDVLVRIKDDCIHLSVRGTQVPNFKTQRFWEAISNCRDVIRDLRFIPWLDEQNYWTHKGFAISAERWVSRYALRLSHRRKPVKVYGHSLGAGIASHMAKLLLAMGFDVLEVVAFGEPAGYYFGSEEKYCQLNIPTTSYLHGNDWIQHAPPWGETCVPRTTINPQPGISRKAHNIELYAKALAGQAEL